MSTRTRTRTRARACARTRARTSAPSPRTGATQVSASLPHPAHPCAQDDRRRYL